MVRDDGIIQAVSRHGVRGERPHHVPAHRHPALQEGHRLELRLRALRPQELRADRGLRGEGLPLPAQGAGRGVAQPPGGQVRPRDHRHPGLDFKILLAKSVITTLEGCSRSISTTWSRGSRCAARSAGDRRQDRAFLAGSASAAGTRPFTFVLRDPSALLRRDPRRRRGPC